MRDLWVDKRSVFGFGGIKGGRYRAHGVRDFAHECASLRGQHRGGRVEDGDVNE